MNYKYPFSGEETLNLLNGKEEDKDKKVPAIIVTMQNGVSYDELFRSVQQESQEGTKVLVYTAPSDYLTKFIAAFEGKPEDDTAKQMMKYIAELDANCVVFNWECSSAYGDENFL